MANLQDLKSVIDATYPDKVYSMISRDGISLSEVRYVAGTSPEDKAGIRAIIDSFDWNAAPPDITGFFDALGKAIVFDQSLPPDIYLLALVLKDQKELKYQQIMLQALASNPVYTKEQKLVLNSLLKQYNLLLPEVATK